MMCRFLKIIKTLNKKNDICRLSSDVFKVVSYKAWKETES